MPDCPHGEEVPVYTQVEPLPFQLKLGVFRLPSKQHWEETGSIFLMTSL